MPKPLSLLAHAIVLAAAFRGTYSAGGFLVTGIGLALLLDRYVLRVLPWAGPPDWRREVRVRVGCFVLGAVGFYFLRLVSARLFENIGKLEERLALETVKAPAAAPSPA